MRQKAIEYQDDELTVTVTVGEATALAGMKFARLGESGRKEMESEPDVDVRLLRLYTFPACMAATVSVTGLPWPLTFEQFLELPDRLTGPWERAAYELNAHWLPVAAEDAAKKAPGSTPV